MSQTPSLQYQKILQQIADRCQTIGRNPQDIKILLATKTQSTQRLQDLLSDNIHLFGENKTQELITKQKKITQAKWHFIGHLQTNKAKDIIGRISLLHSLDSLKLADKLNGLLREQQKKLDILIQINTSGEATKYGFKPSEADKVVTYIQKNCPHITPKGFMTMAAPGLNEDARACFKQLKKLSEAHSLPELSMGMSNDYMVAIEEGSTLVRLGSCIFGKRS